MARSLEVRHARRADWLVFDDSSQVRVDRAIHAKEGAWINDLAGNALDNRMNIGSSGMSAEKGLADIRRRYKDRKL